MSRPTDVQVVRADGRIVPCELAPKGTDADGIDVWEIATELHHGDALKVGILPGRTAIEFPTDGKWAS